MTHNSTDPFNLCELHLQQKRELIICHVLIINHLLLTERLQAQLEKTQASWNAYITQVSKETVAKDTELLSAGDREAKIREELQKCKENAER